MSMKITIAALMIASATPAAATELVTNGNFSGSAFAGNPSGWTASGTGNNAMVRSISGNNVYAFGSGNGESNTLSQSVATIAGAKYVFSFQLSNFAEGRDSLVASFGDLTVFSQTPVTIAQSSNVFTSFTYDVTATSELTRISFSGFDAPGFIYLDNVSVQAAGPSVAAAVPEPASWAMMIGGFGVIGDGLRTRRRAVKFANA